MRESSLKSFCFALKAVYSGNIKAIFSKALGAIAAGAGALKTAAVAIYTRTLEAAAAAVTAATVARVTRSCLRLLRPSGMLIVLNLRFSY